MAPTRRSYGDYVPWTAEEDEQLRQLVKRFGSARDKCSRWSEHLPGRTAKNCRKRWFYSLDPNIKKSIPWTPEEDKRLLELVARYGSTWCRIARDMDGRTDDQCAARYQNVLSVTDRPWSAEEDEHLLALQAEMGNKWKQIAAHFEGRSPLSCRNRCRKFLGTSSKSRRTPVGPAQRSVPRAVAAAAGTSDKPVPPATPPTEKEASPASSSSSSSSTSSSFSDSSASPLKIDHPRTIGTEPTDPATHTMAFVPPAPATAVPAPVPVPAPAFEHSSGEPVSNMAVAPPPPPPPTTTMDQNQPDMWGLPFNPSTLDHPSSRAASAPAPHVPPVPAAPAPASPLQSQGDVMFAALVNAALGAQSSGSQAPPGPTAPPIPADMHVPTIEPASMMTLLHNLTSPAGSNELTYLSSLLTPTYDTQPPAEYMTNASGLVVPPMGWGVASPQNIDWMNDLMGLGTSTPQHHPNQDYGAAVNLLALLAMANSSNGTAPPPCQAPNHDPSSHPFQCWATLQNHIGQLVPDPARAHMALDFVRQLAGIP